MTKHLIDRGSSKPRKTPTLPLTVESMIVSSRLPPSGEVTVDSICESFWGKVTPSRKAQVRAGVLVLLKRKQATPCREGRLLTGVKCTTKRGAIRQLEACMYLMVWTAVHGSNQE